MCLVQKMKSCVSKSLIFMNYNNVINWFFLPFLIVVLMLRTYGAKAPHMWCGALTRMVRRAEYKSINYSERFYLLIFGSTSDVKK